MTVVIHAPRAYSRAVERPLRCVLVLSSKSSGSSALQSLLCKGTNARHIEHTRHAESETLYWTKAASILGLPQSRMIDSEVPIPARKARSDLIALLSQNVPEFTAPDEGEALVFSGWRALCRHYAPVFVEKSPHHLHQWSCLRLMSDAAARLPDIDFRFVGLVRNPMDTLYSAWSRWRQSPARNQFEWLEAHQNLLRFKDLVGDRLTIVGYETLASDPATARALLEKVGIESGSREAAGGMHAKSLQIWKKDRRYGFELDPRVYALAAGFGYTQDQLSNRSSYRWKLHHALGRGIAFAWSRPRLRMRRLVRPHTR
jgi:hypothetical protein